MDISKRFVYFTLYVVELLPEKSYKIHYTKLQEDKTWNHYSAIFSPRKHKFDGVYEFEAIDLQFGMKNLRPLTLEELFTIAL